MRKFILFFIAILFSWISFAQLHIGILASQGGGGGSDFFVEMNNLQKSQISPVFTGIGSWFAGGVDISPDGSKWVMAGRSVDGLAWGTMTTSHNFFTAFYSGVYTITDYSNPAPNSIGYEDSGTQIWVSDDGLNGIAVWDLSTPYDFTTRTFDTTHNLSNSTNEYSIEPFNDGDRFVVTESNSNIATEYSLSTPYDLSSTISYERDIVYTPTSNSNTDNHVNTIVLDSVWLTTATPDGNAGQVYTNGLKGGADPFSSVSLKTSNKNMNISDSDRIWAFRYHEGQDYWFEASYSDDRLVKYRDVTKAPYSDFEEGKQYEFPSDDFNVIGVTDIGLRELGNSMTVIIDHKFESGTNNQYYELFASTSSNYFICRYDDQSERLFFQIYNGTIASNMYTTSGSFDADDQYHQVAFQYDASAGVRIYVDGALMNSNSDTDVQNFSTTVDASIPYYLAGRYNGGQESGGAFDKVAMYNGVLTAQEIEDTFDDWSSKPTTGLVADFNEKKGDYFWFDSSGNGRVIGVEGVTKTDKN